MVSVHLSHPLEWDNLRGRDDKGWGLVPIVYPSLPAIARWAIEYIH